MKKLFIPFLLVILFLAGNTYSQNLLINGDFESGFDEWENVVADSAIATFTLETSDVYEGSGAMKLEITTLGTNDWSVQSMHSAWSSVTGTEYKLTLYAKSETGTSIRAVQQLNEYDAQDFTLSSEWTKYEWIFLAKENDQQLKFHFYDDGIIYIDNITIEENSTTYPSDNTLEVNTDIHYQTMQGFGGAIAFYNNWVFAHPNKEELYQLLWEDLGINLLRLRNTYRYETDFTTDDIELVQKAEEYSDKDFKLLMCSWSPPASLKSNGNVNNGTLAQVNGEFVYQDFADYWRDALVAYRAIGINPDWIGIQNEPDFQTDSWETCKFTPTETDEFPGFDIALETVNNTISSLDNPPLLLGAEELGIGYNNFNNYSDPIKEAPYLWAYGYHLYHGGDPEIPDSYNTSFLNIVQNYNDRPNIMTEYEHFDAGWFKTAWLVCNNISVGNTSAYFYWNLIWPGSGLISIDNPWDQANWSNEKGYTLNPHFYAFKHFAKFVDAGYERVECTNTNEGIKSSVFISPDGSELVMVLLNVADHSVTTNVIPAGWENETSQIFQSVEGNYFQSLGSVSIGGMMDLPSQSITTLVFGADVSVVDPTSISVSPATLSMQVGDASQLTATVLPDNATNKNVTWSSTNTNVATVTNSGIVTAVGEGNAEVIATTEVGGLTDACSITVLPETGEDYYSLSVNITGSGTVTTSPDGGLYLSGTEVTLTAAPDEGYQFDSWSGDINSTSTTVVITMDSDKSVEAIFSEIPEGCDSYELLNLPFSFTGAGTFCWEVRGNIEYVNSWGCDVFIINGQDYCGSWSNEFLPIDNDVYYIQYSSSVAWSHVEIAGTNSTGEEFTLTVNTSVGGSVSPSGGSYPEGTEVTLTATPDEGYVFDGWSGDASGTNTTISITMDSDKSITATFVEENVPVYYTLSVTINGNGSVTPNGGTYEEGSVVNLVATADAGNEFVSWSGDVSSSSSSINITMDADKSITATFQASNGELCSNPVTIALPYSQNGAGEYCWFTSDGISYVNSWNMTLVEINGVDFTNTWSDNMPPAIDGGYYIYYEGEFGWSHFEAAGPKAAESLSNENKILLYPNPFNDMFKIYIKNPNIIERISLVNQIGKIIREFDTDEISENMMINSINESGIYYLVIITSESTQTIKIIKN